MSLQHMAEEGARLMGRLASIKDGVLLTEDTLAENIAFADERSAQFNAAIDEYIESEGIDAPEPEADVADRPAGPEVAAGGLTRLDLEEANVSTVIWCTGFTADFSWIHLPVVDAGGRPIHHRGVADVPGIYFLGFPWLHSRKSGVLLGIEEDGAYIADFVAERLDRGETNA